MLYNLMFYFFFGFFFFFSSRRRHTRWNCDWSSDVCSSDLVEDVPDHSGLVGDAAFDAVRSGPLEDDLVLRRVLLTVRRLDDLRRHAGVDSRSEERRVGKEGRSRLWPYTDTKKTMIYESRRR